MYTDQPPWFLSSPSKIATAISSPVRVEGSLIVTSGTITLTGGLDVSQNLTLAGGILVVAEASVQGRLSCHNWSLISPFLGVLQMAPGAVLSVSSASRLRVSGCVSLAGTLEVALEPSLSSVTVEVRF